MPRDMFDPGAGPRTIGEVLATFTMKPALTVLYCPTIGSDYMVEKHKKKIEEVLAAEFPDRHIRVITHHRSVAPSPSTGLTASD